MPLKLFLDSLRLSNHTNQDELFSLDGQNMIFRYQLSNVQNLLQLLVFIYSDDHLVSKTNYD